LNVALVNTNRVKPPVAPIGIEYVAEALLAAGHSPCLLDLGFEEDWRGAVSSFFRTTPCGLVGVTLRNTDDCSFATRESFIPFLAAVVGEIRRHTASPVVLGGSGFSVMPTSILVNSGADAGIWGEGEFIFPQIATLLEKNRSWSHLPNLVVKRRGGWHATSRSYGDLNALPGVSRRFVDNRRYFAEGGQAGFETKRGCTGLCIYCADPVAKGAVVRTRSAGSVVGELRSLVEQGIDHFHTCDSEFNIPAWHALEVCESMKAAGLGEKTRWYAYCSPVPFGRDLARAMRRAGCVGINFGVDSGDPNMLRRLKRMHAPEDIQGVVRACKETGIRVMADLLLGAPGETRESVTATVELMKRMEVDVVGVGVGLRVYRGTELARLVKEGRSVENLVDPPFFLEPGLGQGIFALIDTLVAGDERFLFFDPTRPKKNYNYNSNSVLCEAIGKGARGAYWDILTGSPLIGAL
jgi:hypothetical protein